jgi:hypothetical protein
VRAEGQVEDAYVFLNLLPTLFMFLSDRFEVLQKGMDVFLIESNERKQMVKIVSRRRGIVGDACVYRFERIAENFDSD